MLITIKPTLPCAQWTTAEEMFCGQPSDVGCVVRAGGGGYELLPLCPDHFLDLLVGDRNELEDMQVIWRRQPA